MSMEGSRLQVLQEKPFEPRFLTGDPRLKRLIEQAYAFAREGMSVCILGESGVGKSLLASDLHDVSGRSGAFSTVECPSIAENLAESELFGHVKGAFTGAASDRIGSLEIADKGSVFLDEIGDLPASLQAKLLRASQDGIIRRVGASEDIEIDVQWFTATNVDLVGLVEEGKFRNDLYYRLCDCDLTIPGLRERKNDITLLCSAFLHDRGESLDRLTEDARDKLLDYSWPGNVRELRHVLRRAFVLSKGERIDVQHIVLQERLGKNLNRLRIGVDPGIRVGDSLASAEEKLIDATVSQCRGNQSAAAEILGIGRSTVGKRLRRTDTSKSESKL